MVQSSEFDSMLEKLYYDATTGLISASKLYKKAKTMEPKITLKLVKEFVRKQKLSQVFTPFTHQKAKFQITGVVGHYQSDLTFYEQYKRQNSNYSIILTLIEVNSKRAYATALKDKNSTSMKDGLEKLIKQLRADGLIIRVIQSDNGTEYTNRQVSEYLKDENIEQVFCPVSVLRENDKRCLAVAERFNRTIKSLLNKYMESNNTARWVDALDDVVANYNQTYHSSIKMRPIDVGEKEEKQIITRKVQSNLNARNQLANRSIQIGDQVRLPVKKKQFDKEGKNFTDQVYIVDKVNSKTIRVQGQDTLFPMDKVLRISEVQSKPPTKQEVSQQKQPTMAEAKKEAKVERVLKKEGVDTSNVREARLRSRKPVNYKV